MYPLQNALTNVLNELCVKKSLQGSIPKKLQQYVMRSTSGYASIWCIFFHQLQPRDSMAPIWFYRFIILIICSTGL